ncbi:unnamed protein product [Rotaria sp. Silwood1]|nr:unnamed protein product [Rotaria sp. Silwood1]CAF3507865.1 unnamed protein product [Rotaria sp. Silwood1]CAF4755538.1 unnamed protein product [Rotaria sp. Silwood1]CAF5097128.1 unnamed protein product [Rotaria sp. Silwood1]
MAYATIHVNISTEETVVWNVIPGEEYDGNSDSKLELNCQKQPRNNLHCTYDVISRHDNAIVDDTNRLQ